MPDIFIDAREMRPPEPLERALAALDLLGDDGGLTLMLKRRPYPLFLVLSNKGYKWNESEEAGGGFKYQIFKKT